MLINAKITQIEANLFTFRSIVYSMKENCNLCVQNLSSTERVPDVFKKTEN